LFERIEGGIHHPRHTIAAPLQRQLLSVLRRDEMAEWLPRISLKTTPTPKRFRSERLNSR